MGSELDSYYRKLIVAIYKGMPDYLDSPLYMLCRPYPSPRIPKAGNAGF